jgi:hypothetical protein
MLTEKFGMQLSMDSQQNMIVDNSANKVDFAANPLILHVKGYFLN